MEQFLTRSQRRTGLDGSKTETYPRRSPKRRLEHQPLPSPLDVLDPFSVKQQLDRLENLRELGRRVTSDAAALRTARRALLPLPLIDRRAKANTKVFPPFRSRPIPSLRSKKIGLTLSGGSGSCVAVCGVVRALEEAGVEPHAISVCSGSALWGSMLAAGLTAQEMVDLSLNWQPEDYLDIQWARLPRFALAAMRGGFPGVGKGEAIERLFDRQLWNMSAGETNVPIYSPVYNIDKGRLETFGSKPTPKLTIGELVRIAVALPLLVEAVKVGDHMYADGGVVDVFPAEPLIDHERLDLVIGVNTILPPRFEGEDISGWSDRPLGFMTANRQLSHAGHLELARRTRQRLGRKLILVDPIDYSELHGWRFYDVFIDRRKWPRLIMQGYEHTKRVLERHARHGGARRRVSAAKPVAAAT
jgi:predicted acylesterase/phospholipase RssA